MNVRASDGGLRVTLTVPDSGKAVSRPDNETDGDSIFQGARQSLATLGIVYNEDSFVERAKKGNTGAVRLFLGAGMDLNVKDKRGNTALITAAANGYAAVVELQLNGGANVNEVSESKETPLVAAASWQP